MGIAITSSKRRPPKKVRRPASGARSSAAFHRREASGLQQLARLELRQEPVDLLLLLERGEAPLDVVPADLGPGLTDGLGLEDAVLHPVEGRARRALGAELRVAGALRGPGAPVARDEQVALGARLDELGLEAVQAVLQCLDLRLLIADLLLEVFGELLVAHRPLEG